MRDMGSPEREETPRRRAWTAGPAAAFAILRGLPARLRRPEALLMAMALLASVGAHMPPYVGLGALADYFASQEPPKSLAPVEVSFDLADESEPKSVTPEPKRPELPEKKQPPEPRKAEAQPEPAPKLRPEPPPTPKVVPAAPPVPPPSQQRRQSVTQKSDNPDEPPPLDAQFLAEENRSVVEQTVARVTDEMRDNQELAEGAQQKVGPRDFGDSDENERGEQKQASQAGDAPTRTEAQAAPPKSAEPAAVARPRVAPREAKQATPETIQDPMGSFVLAPARVAQEGRRGQKGRPRSTPNLKVSWKAFEQTFGEEELARDRLPKQARSLGAGREKKWGEFKAAIENYITGVKPGNTTALNAAADPFAAYLAAFHRHLHQEFAYNFLASLPLTGEFADASLVTKVEIVVNADGSLDRVGVVKSSGNLMYDYGAFNAVQRGAPYPPPPSKIRSPDGRAYFHWALHRDPSQCATWNAAPFILRKTPRSPNDPQPDNVSPYRMSPFEPSGGKHGRAPARDGEKGRTIVKPGDTLG